MGKRTIISSVIIAGYMSVSIPPPRGLGSGSGSSGGGSGRAGGGEGKAGEC